MIEPFYEPRHEAVWRAAAEAGRELATQEDPVRIVAHLGGRGLLGHCVPAEFGGASERVEVRAICAARRALGYHSSLVDTMFAMQGLGSYPIALSQSPLSGALLPRVARGELICAFALTEPEAGSDVQGIRSRATRDGAGFRLDGEKTFISNAGIAGSYVVFARTADDPRRGISAFHVDGESAGLSVDAIELIAPHPIGRVRLAGTKATLLGREGDGLSLALGTLDRFRPSVGAAAAGMAARALDEAIAHVRSRRQFGKPLAEQQATQLALAEMALDLEASDLLVARAAWLADTAEGRHTRSAALAKLHATEAAQRVIDRSLQLHGGIGVVRGHPVERLYREVRALRIYEGTSEIQKLVIARDLLR